MGGSVRDETITSSLGERFHQVLLSLPGAPERVEMADLLMGARWFCLDEDFVRQASNVVEGCPFTIEANLDFLGYPGSPIWIEYPNRVKLGRGGQTPETRGMRERIPDRTGVLIDGNAAFDDNPSVLFALVAWEFPDRSVHFSPAAIYWDLDELARHAGMARRHLSKNRDEAIARLLDRSSVSMLPHLEAEMAAFHGDEKEFRIAVEEGMRNSVSEVPFLLCALLLLNTRDTTKQEMVALTESMTRSLLRIGMGEPRDYRSLSSRLLGRKLLGFMRERTRDGEILRFQQDRPAHHTG